MFSYTLVMIESDLQTSATPATPDQTGSEEPILTPTPEDGNNKKKPNHSMLLLPIAGVLITVVVLAIIVNRLSPSKQPTSENVVADLPLYLTLNTAESNQAVNSELLISGNTLPDTTVLIYSDIDDETVLSNSTGEFEGTVLISEETKGVTVTAYGENDQEMSQTYEIIAQEGL